MELQINSLEIRIEKMQEMFNKDLEEIKKSQSIMNNAITEIKNTLVEKSVRSVTSYSKAQLPCVTSFFLCFIF